MRDLGKALLNNLFYSSMNNSGNYELRPLDEELPNSVRLIQLNLSSRPTMKKPMSSFLIGLSRKLVIRFILINLVVSRLPERQM